LSAKDKDGDKDDDGMSASKDKDGDRDDDGMDASERANRGVARSRKVAGLTSKHEIRHNVSFVNKIFPTSPDSREFPLEQQPAARQPRGTDSGADVLDRSYESRATMERIAGAFASKDGDTSDGGYVPAGAGETWNGDTRSIPTRGTPGSHSDGGFMRSGEGDAGHSGGVDRGVKPARPNLGRDGAYSLEADGLTPGAGVVRSGPNWILPGRSNGLGMSAPFIEPEPRDSVLKAEGPVRNENRKGLFSSVINDTSAMKDYS
jgi:hypothetical protein